MERPKFCQKGINIHISPGRLSKLHIKVRDKLNLKELGFESEKTIGRYRVDEFNHEHNLIIEINGDYIHANPKIYKAKDVIRLLGNSYTAEQKWKKDKKRFDFLSASYTVFVVWESDDLEKARVHIEKNLTE